MTINLVTYKKYNSETKTYDRYHEVENMDLSTFMLCLNNLSELMQVHWSIDFLNPKFTTATVYLEF